MVERPGETYPVLVGAGSFLDPEGALFVCAHRWTSGGVSVHGAFSGAHLLHAAVGGCVLNDVYREAAAAGTVLAGVRVEVEGGFDAGTWASTGVRYRVEVDSDAGEVVLSALIDRVERVAEIPRTLRAASSVERIR